MTINHARVAQPNVKSYLSEEEVVEAGLDGASDFVSADFDWPSDLDLLSDLDLPSEFDLSSDFDSPDLLEPFPDEPDLA